ncbi:phospholipase A1 member A isoform X2 [Denticeps clupeoides]|uniref:Phospholipase A1 member A n=1 Tax=Denticeps clupeoides TaxID=299321 RepID=A0AAY4DS37_9TELE|nr:phospholipase A1 member A isoform X2 [Denticeps clupeoides]
MAWTSATAFLCVLLLCVASAVGDSGDPTVRCEDFSNSTWLGNRNGEKLQVQYLLFTRKDPNCACPFSHESLNKTRPATHFNSSLATKVIIHGFRALGTKPSWVNGLVQALLRAEDANVLVVDWIYSASFAYNRVVENYREVALEISVLINQLKNHGSTLESFHFIGVSLGAHVAGFVGTLFEGKLGRITGLDPAGPMFKGADVYDRLDPSDALFVDAIHTDSDYFGISIPVGHVDFFLNGGMDQTGCARSRFASILIYFPVYGYVICDHMRALHVYMSALNGSCALLGFPCSSYEDFLTGNCFHCTNTFGGSCPRIGLQKNAGISVYPLPSQEKVYLLTTSMTPFCAHHIVLELEVSPLDKSAEVHVTLRTIGHSETEEKLKLHTKATMYKRVLGHPETLCRIDSIELKSTGARFYRQGDLHVASLCISEFPFNRENKALCLKNINLERGVPWSHDLVQACES